MAKTHRTGSEDVQLVLMEKTSTEKRLEQKGLVYPQFWALLHIRHEDICPMKTSLGLAPNASERSGTLPLDWLYPRTDERLSTAPFMMICSIFIFASPCCQLIAITFLVGSGYSTS